MPALSLSRIPPLRLLSQRIDATIKGEAADVVRHLVAVQSQDYAGAKWALGLRLRSCTEAQVEQAFNAGQILRTHVLRPTWHFVLPQDIRWLLALTGPRVQAANAGRYRDGGLTPPVLRKAESVLEKALSGHRYHTRGELRQVLERARIPTRSENSLAYALMHAELQGLICSGPRRGKQFTYALLDERAPGSARRSREEALLELARRYFVSRGPATARDFAKWSGVTLADARRSVHEIGPDLHTESIEGQAYWFGPVVRLTGRPHSAHLLSVYDEYVSSYKDHAVIAGEEITRRLHTFGSALTNIMVFNGLVAGTWKRSLTRDASRFVLDPFRRLDSQQRHAFRDAAERYARFHGLKPVLA